MVHIHNNKDNNHLSKAVLQYVNITSNSLIFHSMAFKRLTNKFCEAADDSGFKSMDQSNRTELK